MPGDAFEEAGEPLIEALVTKLEGKTQKQKNPRAKGTLARAAWVIRRLGGWSGYAGGGYKPPGPKTMYDGLVQCDPSGEAGRWQKMCDSRRPR